MKEFLIGDDIFETIFDALPSPIFVVDHDVRMLGYNLAAVPLFGSERDRILRMKPGDALSCLNATDTPQGCGGGEACKKCVIRNSVNKSYGGDKIVREKCEMQVIRGGTVEIFQMLVTTASLKFKDELYVLVTLEDITEFEEAKSNRKQAEDELEESYNIINRSPAVAFLWNNEEQWPVEYVSNNVKNLFGYTAEELKSGKISYSKIVHPDDLDRVVEEVVTNSKEKTRKSFSHDPYRIVTKGGEVKWLDDRTFIRRDEKGIITHYQGIVLDITDRQKVEEEKGKLIIELQTALSEVKTLRGIIPICSNCKKIRDGEGYWQQVEKYIQDHSEAKFSHGICHECVKKLYPDLDIYNEDKTQQ